MTDKERAVKMLNVAAENAIDAGLAGVMVVATDGQETLTFPEMEKDVDPYVVTLWMVGAHLKHVEDSAKSAGGSADMRTVAEDAISFVEEYEYAEDAGI